MMSGYCRIEDWTEYSKQLDHVHTLYEHYIPYLTGEGKATGADPSEVLFPVVLYITVLGRSGLFQKAFDVFHELPSEGPYAANPLIYGALLDALSKRRLYAQPNTNDEEFQKVISLEAKYVWRRILRSMEKEPEFVMNERILDSFLKTISQAGASGDPDFAFDIIRDNFGLLRPDDALPKTRKEKYKQTQAVPLSQHSLLTVLQFANMAQKPEYCIHYSEQVMASSKMGGLQLFVYPHAVETLYAHNALALAGDMTQANKATRMLGWVFQREGSRPSVQPPRKAYTIAWRICATCGDWNAAKRVFYMATGHMADESAKYKRGWLGKPGGELSLNEWQSMFKAVLASGDADEVALCVEMLESFGADVVKSWRDIAMSRGTDLKAIRAEFREDLSESQRLASMVVKADISKAPKEVSRVVRPAAQGFLSKVGGLLASARKGSERGTASDAEIPVEDEEIPRTELNEKQSRTGARRRLPMPN